MSKLKDFIKNIFGLGMVNLINLIIPLLLIPFLSRLISGEQYGYIMYITTIQMFSTIFLDYSFNITSVKEYVQNERNRINIFIETQISRFFLSILYVFIILFYTSIVDGSLIDIVVYVLPFAIGHFFISQWYYQAKTELIKVAFVVVVLRLIHLAIVIVFSKNEEINEIVLISQSYTYLISGVILAYISRKEYVHLINCVFDRTIFYLKKSTTRLVKSFGIFISDFSPNLYTNLPTILLMNFINPAVYFQYNIAVKYIGVGLMIQTIVSRSLYPILCKDRNFNFMKILAVNIFPTLCFSIVSVFLSSNIFMFITSSESSQFGIYLNIMLVGMIFAVLGNVLGQNYLLVKTNGTLYSKIIFLSCVLSGILGVFLIQNFEDVGAAWLLTIGRFLFFISCIYCVMRYKRSIV